MQCGPGCIVGADQVLVVFALQYHGPAPFHAGVAGSQAVAHGSRHFGFPHINLLQSGKTVQEGFERVKILYDGIPKADVLSIQGEGHPVEFSGGVRRRRGFRQGTAG